MRQHQSILEYKNGRYLKLAVGLRAPAIGAYVWHEPPTVYLKPYGGTWLGYTLATAGAVLILWLMLPGIRKRRYRQPSGQDLGMSISAPACWSSSPCTARSNSAGTCIRLPTS